MTSSLTSIRARSLLAEQDSLAREIFAGRVSWRGALSLRPQVQGTWDRAGLEALLEAAQTEASLVLGRPIVLVGSPPWIGYPREGKIREVFLADLPIRQVGTVWVRTHAARQSEPGTGAAMVQTAARAAGWIRAIPDFPILRRASRRAWVPVWEAVERGVTPGAFAHRVAKIQARAAQILAPHGVRPSWRAVFGVAFSGRTAKAALTAAASTLGWRGRGYRGAREFIARVSRSAGTTADSRRGFRGPQEQVLGVSVTPMTTLRGPIQRVPGFLVESGELSTYISGVHGRYWSWESGRWSWTPASEQAARTALGLWEVAGPWPPTE